MTILNMQLATQALKVFYLPGLQEQINLANPFLSVIDRDQESVSGSKIIMALRHGRTGGVGMRDDDGDMPIANARKVDQAEWQTKNFFAAFNLTDKLLQASRNSNTSFVNQLEAQLADAETDARDQISRQCFGTSKGVVGTCKVNTAVTTLALDSVMYLAEGQFIDIFKTSDDSSIATQREILDIDDENNTITISGAAVTTSAGDYLTIFGNRYKELTGMGEVFTPNNTLYNIDRSSNRWFNAQVDAVNSELSEVRIKKNIQNAKKRAGGVTSFLLASDGVERAYYQLLAANKRLGDTMTLNGGYEVVKFDNIPFACDQYVPAGTLYGLDLSTWKVYHMGDFQWLDEDGTILKKVSGKAVWEANLARYLDLGCSKPKGNWMMTGVVEH